MPNEHIEWFKRFAAAQMRWIHFEFDRIVADAVNRKDNYAPFVYRPGSRFFTSKRGV